MARRPWWRRCARRCSCSGGRPAGRRARWRAPHTRSSRRCATPHRGGGDARRDGEAVKEAMAGRSVKAGAEWSLRISLGRLDAAVVQCEEFLGCRRAVRRWRRRAKRSRAAKGAGTAEWGKAASWAEIADALDAAGRRRSQGEAREIYEEFVADGDAGVCTHPRSFLHTTHPADPTSFPLQDAVKSAMEVNRSKVGTQEWDHKGIATAELAAAAAECRHSLARLRRAAGSPMRRQGRRAARCIAEGEGGRVCDVGRGATVLQGCSGDGAAELVQLQEVKNGWTEIYEAREAIEERLRAAFVAGRRSASVWGVGARRHRDQRACARRSGRELPGGEGRGRRGGGGGEPADGAAAARVGRDEASFHGAADGGDVDARAGGAVPAQAARNSEGRRLRRCAHDGGGEEPLAEAMEEVRLASQELTEIAEARRRR